MGWWSANMQFGDSDI